MLAGQAIPPQQKLLRQYPSPDYFASDTSMTMDLLR
jgi:hypothetical protein